MLAPQKLPSEFLRWNQQKGSPFGYRIPLAKKMKRWLPNSLYWRWRGPFSVQTNNTTRAFEYPFVYKHIQASAPSVIVDIGGGLSGFQFALAKEGYQVINVDPGMAAAGKGWPCTNESMDRLNRLFNTSVELRNSTIERANLKPNSIDLALSISVIEHLPWQDVENAMKCVWNALKPGGKFILTIDLFLDIYPFQEKISNKYGSNINIKDLVEVSPFDIELGNTFELYGYDSFNEKSILDSKDRYLVGKGYPAMVQCLVLKKPF